MNGFREAMLGLAEAKHGLPRSNHVVREPEFTLRATNHRPPKRNHGHAKPALCPLEWKNTLKKATS